MQFGRGLISSFFPLHLMDQKRGGGFASLLVRCRVARTCSTSHLGSNYPILFTTRKMIGEILEMDHSPQNRAPGFNLTPNVLNILERWE
ncbi:Uncharacterized protein APZ42_031661 [Daphnia magna]|uniref:Uncharacterized protein n=1 Tax=Daphnia magna TaxID=35525 RepID=A0A164MP03_9CRUS|nr:Uncharacterized protein APZ42_031661 [Daphnia magna]